MKAKLTAAWAASVPASRREPTASEISTGFPCGPADIGLFNEQEYRRSMVEAELSDLVTKSGLTPSESDLLQVAQAVRSQSLNYRVAGGTANALTVTLDPAPLTLPAGMPIRVKISATNTGPATLSVNGLSAPIRNSNGGELVGGDLLAGAIVEVVFDGTVWRLAGHSRGRLLNVRVYSASATYTPTPGTDYVEVEVYGAGGGGGGVAATGAGETASGAGGGSGAYAYKLIRSGFEGVYISVGTGGAGGAAGSNWGSNGTASSFGALVSAPGGGGGRTAGPTNTFDMYYAAGGVGGSVGAGGDINVAGNGARAVSIANRIGDPPPRQPGMMMVGAGFGGEGKASLQNTDARAGETGGNGLVIVREYA